MTEQEDGIEDGRGTRQRMGDGIRSGIGILSALKEALEETIHEARDRGDLSAERAKEMVKEAMGRAQEAAAGARERLDFATRLEVEALEASVEALQTRVAALEARASGSGDAAGGGEPG